MNEQRPLLERAVELVVYAPVGAVIEARERIRTLGPKVAVARWVGEMTVNEARRRLSGVRASRTR